MVIKPSAANQSGVHNTGGQIHSWRLDKRGEHLIIQQYGTRRKSWSGLGILLCPPIGLCVVEAFAEKWKHHGRAFTVFNALFNVIHSSVNRLAITQNTCHRSGEAAHGTPVSLLKSHWVVHHEALSAVTECLPVIIETSEAAFNDCQTHRWPMNRGFLYMC